MKDLFNIEVLFSLFRVSQVPLVLILIFLCFKSINLLRKRELYWVGMGFCFNLNYILFGILSNRLFEVIRRVSPHTKHYFSVISIVSDLLASLCFLFAFASWYYYTYTDIKDKKGMFNGLLSTVKDGRMTASFLVVFTLVFFSILSLLYQFSFDTDNVIVSCIVSIFDCFALYILTNVFIRLSKMRAARNYLVFGFGIWALLQLITPFGLLFSKDFIQLVGYSTSLAAKTSILFGFFLWYISVGNETELQLELQRISLSNLKISANTVEDILRSTFHEVILPLRRMDGDLGTLNNHRYLRGNSEFGSLINSFERLKAIIDVSIHTYSKTHVSEINQKQRIISVNNLAEEAVKTIKASYENLNVQVYYASNCYINCVSVQIIQVFTNLIKNAIEAYAEGEEILIIIRTYNDKDREDDQKIVIAEIEDHAGGIAPAYLDKIWESKFSTKKEDEQNSVRGNGLFITRQIIDRHENSTIHVESPIIRKEYDGTVKEIKGTKFTLTFPRKELALKPKKTLYDD